MPDSVIGGMLGGDDEQPELEALETELGADAFAATIAHQAAQEDPEVAHEAAAFLRGQLHLVDVQTEHLKDEHPLRIAHLKNQIREERLRRLGLRLRVGFQFFVALFALAIGFGVVMMVRDAVNSHDVVIDPFNTPPALAQSGISEKTVASGLLDVLKKIQLATYNLKEKQEISNAWTNQIEIQVPETGVSIGQIQRALKTRYGHDQHITGDLVQTTSGGLALTVRGNGIAPQSFMGSGTDLDTLLTEAGQYIYSQSQPRLWMSYLIYANRYDEAATFAQNSYFTVPVSERASILCNWALVMPNKGSGVEGLRATLPLFRESIRLKPDNWQCYEYLTGRLLMMGDEEGVVHVGEQMMKAAGGRPGRAPEEKFEMYDLMVWDVQASRDHAIVDTGSYIGLNNSKITTTSPGYDTLDNAWFDVHLHDPDAAELILKTMYLDPKNKDQLARATDTRALIAQERGDINTAVTEWDKFFDIAYANPSVVSGNPRSMCTAAVIYQKTGQPAKADAALNAAWPHTRVDCYRFRADILDLRGKWPEAEQWYANAIKLGPSMPAGYYSWGLALERHGDLDGAAIQFATANQKGPHWADPLKAWGDVLMKQGKTQEAQEKYNEALKYAPNWKELKEAIKAGSKS